MKRPWLWIVGTVLPTLLVAQTGRGPYARIAILRPYDGHTVEFEAGYIRHLEWHRQARDPWVWYGWSIWASERQRWFVYATFGHSAGSLDSAVTPAEDERDNVLNVVPHAEFAGQSTLQGETLWYRMVAGGAAPRYVRLRPRPSLAAVLDGRSEQELPDAVNSLIARTTVEILTLRR